jgi:DNA-directed RNA polymerase subunit RPC12/RpoP
MHRFRSPSSVHRLWFASLLLLLGLVGTVALVPALACGILTLDQTCLVTATGLVALVAVSGITYGVLALDAKCPLCRGRLLMSQGCSRHTRARKLLGSHRLRVAAGVLLDRPFRCPYCGEVCECVATESRH